MGIRKLMVTGGAGFIGSNFIRHWLKNHPEDLIINFDLLTYAGNLDSLKDVSTHANYRFVQSDIRNQSAVDSVVADVTHIVHFAAESHVDRSIANPEVFITTNVLGTHVLLESALKHKLERFHHVSTDEVFGSLELNSSEKFNLSTAYNPRSPYSASKAGSDHLVRAYGETFGLPFTITNCSNNYGAYQYPEKLFPLAITNLIRGKKVPIYGDGLNVRDWLEVNDHCRAIEGALLHGKVGKTYLVGGLNEDISNLEAIKLILKLMNQDESTIEFVPDRLGHDRRYAIDWSQTAQELNYQPQTGFEEGIRNTIEWHKANQWWWEKLIK